MAKLLCNMNDVVEMTGHSKRWIEIQIELGNFPPPARGGGKGSKRWWRESDIVEWCNG